MLEDANLCGAKLRFARLEGAVLEACLLRRADLWGAFLAGAIAHGADLRGATLREADLKGADLSEANLRRAMLSQARLQGTKLRGADLRRASIAGADLGGADLRDARLDGLDFSRSLIPHVSLGGARLARTRFERDQLGGAVGEELAAEHDEARKAYLALERLFQESGDPDGASWAYRRKRRMEKLDALDKARDARDAGDRRAMIACSVDFASNQVVEWVCDYGESAGRILKFMGVILLAFAMIYGLTGGVVRTTATVAGEVKVTTRRPIDLFLFSLFAMASPSNPPVGLLPRDEVTQLLSGVQALIGIALTGLLGFVMGNLVRR